MEFSVLLNTSSDPLVFWIVSDSVVLWVHKDDFEVLVGRVFTSPVGVENTESTAVATDTLFSNRLKSASELHENPLVLASCVHHVGYGFCKRRNLEWLCIPIVEPFQVELVLKPGGWRSNFCIARHEPVANNASFPIAFCARFRSYTCMRPYFNLSVRQSKSDSKMG